jgi:type I restriction enzyme ecoAI specificity protein
MDTKKLRQKILDLAIHGKLVPQDPNDEPASVLLERIRAEKERLIKEGKIKRSRKTAKTSDTPHYEHINFALPKNWQLSTLGEVFYMHAGKNIVASEISSNADETYRYKCIGGNGLRGYVQQFNTEGSSSIIGRQGALCGNINYVEGRFYATEHAVVVDTFCKTNVKWAFYFLIKLNLNQYATATAQPGLSVNTICDVQIPLPPLTEQQRIVAEIERWFALIDTVEQGKADLQTAIKQTKSKILDLAIHGKLVPQDPNDEPASELLKRINPKAQITCDNEHSEKLPQGWCTCRLKDISIIITGSTPSKSNPNYYGGDVPFYKPADLDAGRFLEKSMEHVSEAGKKISRVVPMGSTAVCCIGSIGKVGYLTQEGITNQQINSAIPSEAVNSLFLYYTCASPSFYNELQLLSSAVTISIINKSKMENIKVSLPPLLEQKCIVKKIEELFTVLDTIEQSLQA